LNIKSCETKERNIAELMIEVDAEELDSAINEAFRKNKGRISVPGFRKGKASRKMIERMYGASIFHSDALENLMPNVMKFAADESGLKIISYPEVTDVTFAEDASNVVITLEATLYPEVTLGEYKGLSAPKLPAEVPDEEIDREVMAVRLRNARIEKVERPAENGDIAVIDFEGFLDGVPFDGGKGENHDLELGSGSFIPGFEDKILGMSVDEERDIDLVFPDEYAEELAGKAVVFKVKLNELREKQLPDMDDEFAKDVSEFDTLEDYRADIKARFLKTKQDEVDSAFENALLDKLVEITEADVPVAMVEEQMDISMKNFTRQCKAYGMAPATYLELMNTTPEDFRESSRASSEKQVKAMLALMKIAEIEGIEVDDEEIENEYLEGARRYGTDVEKVKESVDRESIVSDVKLRLATKIISDNAIIEELTSESEAEAEKAPAKPKKAKAKKTEPEEAEKVAEAEPNEESAVASVDEKPAPKKTAAKKAKKPADDA